MMIMGSPSGASAGLGEPPAAASVAPPSSSSSSAVPGCWLSGSASRVSLSVLQWDKEGVVGRVPSTRAPGGFIKVVSEEVPPTPSSSSVLLLADGGESSSPTTATTILRPPPRKILRLSSSSSPADYNCGDSSSSSSVTNNTGGGGGGVDGIDVCVSCGTFALRSEFYRAGYCVATCFFNCAREDMKEVVLKNAPLKLFKQPALPNHNPFRVGMLLEALDPENASLFCVVSVVRVLGCRVQLHFEGYPTAFDFWVNSDSIDIFPPGWTVENGHELQPPFGFVGGEFQWPVYVVKVRKQPAPRSIFQVVRDDYQQQQHQNQNQQTTTNSSTESSSCCSVRVGMKLEAVDIRNCSSTSAATTTAVDIMSTNSSSMLSPPPAPPQQICVASVSKVLGGGEQRRFLVHFDSWDCIYDYWADLTCPFIHPIGFAKANNKQLNPPNSWDVSVRGEFDWDVYMSEEGGGAVPLPAHLFQPLPPVGFKKGMRIEAVDVRCRSVVRPAVVVGVDGHMLTVQYDNTSSSSGSSVGDSTSTSSSSSSSGGGGGGLTIRVTELSNDIHPVGYARHTNHPIHYYGDHHHHDGDDNSNLAAASSSAVIGERVVVVNNGSGTVVVTPGELILQQQQQQQEEDDEEDDNEDDDLVDSSQDHHHRSSSTAARSTGTAPAPAPPPPPALVAPPPCSPSSRRELSLKMSALALRVLTSSTSAATSSTSSSLTTTRKRPVVGPSSTGPPPLPLPPPPPLLESYVFEGLCVGLSGEVLRGFSVDEVSNLVSRLPGCGGVATLLRDQLVDGDAFLMINRDDLNHMIMSSNTKEAEAEAATAEAAKGSNKQQLPLGVWLKIKYLRGVVLSTPSSSSSSC